MIRLIQDSSSQKFALTCSQVGALVNPFYLFVFVHEMTKTEKRVVLTDSSAHKVRYNLFELTGTYFELSGWYNYTVYEQTSAVNTDETLSGSELEEGRLFVEPIANVEFKENKTDTNFTEYAG
jgi:hypothetical protein